MQLQTRKLKAAQVFYDWQTDLKDIDRKKRQQFNQQCRKSEPILIDYGSDTIKAGFLTSLQPELIFKPLSCRSKEAMINSFVNTINFSYDSLDMLRSNLKSAYERNIIQHFSVFEHCTDFILSNFNCTDDHVKSPLIVSEPPANPTYCRNSMLQMFFEAYGVSEVFIGCDALFAYFHQIECDMSDYTRDTRLIVSFGAATTHIIPVVKGKVDYLNIKRLNIGSNNCLEIMGKLILLKNPDLKHHLSYTALKHLYNKFASVALDYRQQMLFFKSQGETSSSQAYKNKIQEQNQEFAEQMYQPPIEIQFQRPGAIISAEEIKRKQEIKKRMAERLREALERKRQEKQKAYRSQYEELVKIKEKYEADPENKEQLIEYFGEDKPEIIMKKRIKRLEAKLEIESKQEKFALIDVPDNQLPPEKQRLKKLQIYQKAALEERRRKKLLEEEEERKMRVLREQNPQKYLEELRTRYNQLSGKIKETERIKSELANRNSRLNQKKMQTLAQLADEEEADNFGENEEDWMIYRGQEEEDHRSEIEALEVELREIDPSWMVNTDRHHLNTGYTLHLAAEIYRPGEIYFQPYMAGNDQMPIHDIITLCLKNYREETRQDLLNSILFVGGGSTLPGLKQRLQKQLRANSPVGSTINISIAREPRLGCFFGMRGLVTRHPQYVKQHSIKRKQLHENRLKSHDFVRL